MPEKFIKINGTNDVNIEVNATGDTTIFLPAAGGTLAAAGNILNAVTLSGNSTSGGAGYILVSSGTLTFAGGNNITLSQDGNAITISGPNVGGAQTGISGVILSNTTYTSGSFSFRDLNGLTWQSTTGQGVQITHDLQYTSNTSNITSNALHTSASRVINIVAATNNTGGGTASLSSNVSFSNANNFTFYTSAGGAIAASFSQSADTNKAGTGFTSAGNNIGLSGTLNTNGLSLSATVAAQSADTVGVYGSSQTTGSASSGTHDVRSLSFIGAGIISVGNHSTSAGGTTTGIIISATQSAQAFSAGAASSAFQTLVFQDSNAVSFSNNAGSIRVTHDLQYTSNTSNITSNALNTSVSRVINIVAATNNTGGGTASLSSNVSFSNANSFTFYTSAGGAVVGSFSTSQSVQTQNLHNVTLSGNSTSGGAGYIQISSGTLTLAGGNNITLSQDGNAVTISAANAGGAQTAISGVILSNTTYTSGSVSFRDLNGVTWQSTTGQGIQITHDLQYTSNTSNITSNALNTSASRVINIVAATNNTGGGTASLSSNVSFSNANNFTFYTSAGGAIVGSFSQSVDTVKAGTGFTSAGNNIGLSGTLNTNGLSLSATVAAQTNQTVGVYGSSQTTGSASSGTHDARSLSFIGAGIISIGNHSTSAGGTTTGILISATQSAQAFSAGAASSAFQTLIFQDSNGVSFSNNAGSVRITHDLQYTSNTSNITSNALHTSASRVINIVAATNNTGGGTASLSSNVSFSNANGVSFYTSAGGAIVASVNAGGGGIAASIGGNSTSAGAGYSNITSGTMVLQGGPNITLSQNGSLISISANAPGAAAENNWVTLAGNVLSNSSASGSTIQWSGGNNITLYGTNGSQVGISGLSFDNGNGVTFGTNAGTLTASHNGIQSWELEGANTSGTTGSAQGGTLFLSGGNNITLSGNSNTIVISAAGAGYTALTFQNRQLGASTNTVAGQNSVWLVPMRIAAPVSASSGLHMMSITGSVTSNQTNTVGWTLEAAIYKITQTTNLSRFDSIFSTSWGFTFWNSGTASVSYSYNVTSGSSAGSNLMTASVYGLRQLTFNIGSTLDTGLYAWGFRHSSSSAGNSSILRSFNPVIDNPLPVAQGFIGSATTASQGYVDGGTYSVTSGAMPASFVFADIRQTNNAVPYIKIGAV